MFARGRISAGKRRVPGLPFRCLPLVQLVNGLCADRELPLISRTVEWQGVGRFYAELWPSMISAQQRVPVISLDWLAHG
jgi:hypothetical protein